MTLGRCQAVRQVATFWGMSHYYLFKRGDRVRILWGVYAGINGVIDSAVFQRTVDCPDDYSAGYHVVLDDEIVVTVRWDQVRALG